jgi:hypothetical protein
METITVNRVTYVVEAVDTVEQIEARGLHNAARHMRDNGIAANLILRRPAGRVQFFAIRLTSGRVEVRTKM